MSEGTNELHKGPRGLSLRKQVMLLGRCLIGALLASPAIASFQNDDVVTIDTAVREAVAWHPSVEAAVGRLNSRAEQEDVARAGYYPQVSGGIGTGYDDVTGSSSWRPRANLSANQMLYDFGKVSSDVAAAEAGTRLGRARVLIAVDDLARDTALAALHLDRGKRSVTC